MLSVDAYLTFCDETLDAYAGIVRSLGDPLVNATVAGVDGSNSAYAVVSHVVGVMGRWARTVNRGIVVPRDRDAEFTATGTVEEALALLETGRARLHEDVRAADPAAAPENPSEGRDDDYATQGEVLLHVYEELAQHLGQLEVTRDVLLARS
ncbi:DinB family protein [Knoellia sp. CPCC 206435]|uniref:DinB family protein n=1 Tax=Knoellia terrae TaxID=3404797 RepID=UPI003B42FC6E